MGNFAPPVFNAEKTELKVTPQTSNKTEPPEISVPQ
jgi:hypothetical protein